VQAYAADLTKGCPPASGAAQYKLPDRRALYQNAGQGQVSVSGAGFDESDGPIGPPSADRQTAIPPPRNASSEVAVEASGNAMLQMVNVEKKPAYQAAVEAVKAEGVIQTA